MANINFFTSLLLLYFGEVQKLKVYLKGKSAVEQTSENVLDLARLCPNNYIWCVPRDGLQVKYRNLSNFMFSYLDF